MKYLILLSLLSSTAFAGPEISPRYDIQGENIGWKGSPELKSSALISCSSKVAEMEKSIYLTAHCSDLIASAGQKICESEMESTLGINRQEKVLFKECSDQ
jgi:hypothetical protein